MHVSFRNVHDAFCFFAKDYSWGLAKESESRNGPCRFIPEPVTITYTYPWERTLFARPSANPFFHVYESLWMLAGRNDVKSLTYYVSTMSDFSDDGETFHGAYGHRWRSHFALDQLATIEEELRVDPKSRRCVLQMWDCLEDAGCAAQTLDKPCNTHAYFLLIEEPYPRLHMTVCNRSNDMVWGLFGANAVHFSFLHEYMANRINVPMGHYNHVTNNLHYYPKTWKQEQWNCVPRGDRYPGGRKFDVTDSEIASIVERDYNRNYKSFFIREVVRPMMLAWDRYKERDYGHAMKWCQNIDALDWREACTDWMSRSERAYARRS